MKAKGTRWLTITSGLLNVTRAAGDSGNRVTFGESPGIYYRRTVNLYTMCKAIANLDIYKLGLDHVDCTTQWK